MRGRPGWSMQVNCTMGRDTRGARYGDVRPLEMTCATQAVPSGAVNGRGESGGSWLTAVYYSP